MSSVEFQLLMLILGTFWTTMLKSDIPYMSSVKCQMLMLILVTCCQHDVEQNMLKIFCLHVYAQKWVLLIMWYVTCHILHVTCHMSHCACHMSYIKCLCWSLGHAEQLLFWSLCSKVSIYNYVTCRMSHVLCQMLMLILGTCWTTFVFMSMLKCRCLWVKMSMLIFWQQQEHPPLWVDQS